MTQGSSPRKPRRKGPERTERQNPSPESLTQPFTPSTALSPLGPREEPQEIPQILVVDDEVVVRRVLTDYLQGKGYSVAALESGDSALEYLRRSAPDVLLLDIFMPGTNGLEVLRSVRREHYRTQVLVISGFADEELERKVRALGAVECLRKPFDFSRLHALIAGCLKSGTLR